jgi:hypothetical protein
VRKLPPRGKRIGDLVNWLASQSSR